MTDLVAVLAEELDRAHVLAQVRYPEAIVCMGGEMEIGEDTTAESRW